MGHPVCTSRGERSETGCLDPEVYAPSGDIYSYFQRRRQEPFAYCGPSVYQISKAK